MDNETPGIKKIINLKLFQKKNQNLFEPIKEADFANIIHRGRRGTSLLFFLSDKVIHLRGNKCINERIS